MTIYIKIKTEIKEEKCLEGYEICIQSDCILVSSELYKIIDIIREQEDKINRIFDKAAKINEDTLTFRKIGTLPGQAYPQNLAKRGRRNAKGWSRRTIS